MTDEFEDRVAAWLRERGRPDPTSLEVVRSSIEALPARHRGPRRGWLVAAAAIVAVVAIGASAVFLYPQPSGTAPSHPAPTPPDPAAFSGDPRLAACLAAAGPVEFAFEMPHARTYQRHFPAMGLAPELDVDDPAFVVVFAGGAQLLIGGGGPPAASGGPTISPNPTERSVCVLVGDTPNLYEDVDISGMRVDIGDQDTGPSGSPHPSPSPSPASSTPPTPSPAPAEASAAP